MADEAAARAAAVKLAGELLADQPERFWATGDWKVIVTDADQRVLFALTFAAAVPAPTVTYGP